MRKLTDIVLEKNSTDLKSKYEAYFKKKLKEFGVESPADLSDDKKTEFFTAISKGWKSGVGEVKEDYEDFKKSNNTNSEEDEEEGEEESDEDEESEEEESDEEESDEEEEEEEEEEESEDEEDMKENAGKFRFKK